MGRKDGGPHAHGSCRGTAPGPAAAVHLHQAAVLGAVKHPGQGEAAGIVVGPHLQGGVEVQRQEVSGKEVKRAGEERVGRKEAEEGGGGAHLATLLQPAPQQPAALRGRGEKPEGGARA